MIDYVHHTPGRLRTSCPELKKDPNLAEAAAAALVQIKGVISVKASAFTGNLFIRYDATRIEPDVLLESIQQTIKTLGSVPAPDRPSHICSPQVSQAHMNKVGGLLLGMLVEKCIERSAIALVGALL